LLLIQTFFQKDIFYRKTRACPTNGPNRGSPLTQSNLIRKAGIGHFFSKSLVRSWNILMKQNIGRRRRGKPLPLMSWNLSEDFFRTTCQKD
ncbi:MAG: hypothetical protein SWO11_15760, partial [Thermodesulfobacteriota bacterium]|nr:hypothetical protein [Thermodesulfobacteriota bacterium]